MSMRSIFPFLLVLLYGRLFGQTIISSDTHIGPVKWLTFEQAIELNKKDKKQIFIDVYTTWCGPCKMMDKYTFADSAVAIILNTHFYPVKLNAEQREDIKFDNNTFKFV